MLPSKKLLSYSVFSNVMFIAKHITTFSFCITKAAPATTFAMPIWRKRLWDFWRCLVTTYIIITFPNYMAAPVWPDQWSSWEENNPSFENLYLLCISDLTIPDSCKEPLIFAEVQSQFHLPFKKLMWHYQSGRSASWL